MPLRTYLKTLYGNREIDSVFGFVEWSSMYGGRPWRGPEIEDVGEVYSEGIALRLPLTNHHISREEFEGQRGFLEKYDRPGNSVILADDNAVPWFRDYGYEIEASAVKEIDSLEKVEQSLELYDTVVIPPRLSQSFEFLASLPEKHRIRIFANAGCAFNCPSRICYPSFSKYNKTLSGDLLCSMPYKQREDMGKQWFDVKPLEEMGYSRFKLVPP